MFPYVFSLLIAFLSLRYVCEVFPENSQPTHDSHTSQTKTHYQPVPESWPKNMFYYTKCILRFSVRPDVKVFRVVFFFGEPLKRDFDVKIEYKIYVWGPDGAKQHTKYTRHLKLLRLGFILT